MLPLGVFNINNFEMSNRTICTIVHWLVNWSLIVSIMKKFIYSNCMFISRTLLKYSNKLTR